MCCTHHSRSICLCIPPPSKYAICLNETMLHCIVRSSKISLYHPFALSRRKNILSSNNICCVFIRRTTVKLHKGDEICLPMHFLSGENSSRFQKYLSKFCQVQIPSEQNIYLVKLVFLQLCSNIHIQMYKVLKRSP